MGGGAPSFFGSGGRGESRGLLTAAMADASFASCFGGGRGGPAWIGGSSFSFSTGLGLGLVLSVRAYDRPRDNGGSCSGSEGSEGRLVWVPGSEKEGGGAGSALEKRDRPVLGVRRVDDSILSWLDPASPAE
jgi:hypothetical protein